MATARRVWSCPICCDAQGDLAHALPCGHEFCLGCILRWLRGNRTCPLCRGLISTVSFSEQEQDCLQCVLRHPGQATSQPGNAAGSDDGHSNDGHSNDGHRGYGHRDYGHRDDGHRDDGHRNDGHITDGHITHGPVASLASASQGTLPRAEQGAAEPETVGGILPELWAELFRRRWNLLDPVRSWLQQWLRRIYRDRWWQVKTAESSILLALCIFGPDREVLVQRLQPRLRHYTSLLVSGVISIIETECSEEVRRLRGCHAAQEENESPGAGAGPSASPGDAPASGGPPDSSVEHEAGPSEEGPEGSPSTSATVPAEPEQP